MKDNFGNELELLDTKVLIIENDIDIRIESIKNELEVRREKLKNDLYKIKKDLEKYYCIYI